MASEKNITMRQYNGVDYDTLYPKTKVEQVEGAYTQQQILANSTKTLYGLDTTAVPDDVFNVLSRFQRGLGNEYVWEKSTSSVEYKYTVVNTAPYNAYTGSTNQGSTVYIPYGDGFTINSTNEFVLTNRQELVFSYNGNNQNELNILAGKYFFEGTGRSGVQSNLNITKCPIDSTVITEYGQFKMTKCERYGNGKAVTSKTVYGYVNSPDPNAYPPAVSDGYTYTALGQLGAKVQVEAGSYIGTGTYGSSNPNTLTFDFVPEIVIITKNGARYGYGQQEPSAVSLFNGQTSFSAAYNGSGVLTNTVSWGTTVSWYISGYVPGDVISVAPSLQLNNGETYYYIAIG